MYAFKSVKVGSKISLVVFPVFLMSILDIQYLERKCALIIIMCNILGYDFGMPL